ncbi:MAG: heparinase II/III family protein [Fimbriimonadaceae bacterium]|nr:heparinase II/III family protein [Fimbriimonadaceae bacterium]
MAAGSPHRPYTLSPHDRGYLLEDVWPTIYFGAARLPAIRSQVATQPWAADLLATLRAEADAVVAGEEPVQPIERIGWRHDFYSPRTGQHLVYDRTQPDAHRDPGQAAAVTGAPQHRAWVLLTHERTHRLMRSLAVLYGLTGDLRYASWVRDGLLRAVEFFRHDELREGNSHQALYFQPLYDGPALTQFAYCLQLIRAAPVWQPGEIEAVIAGIFERGIPYQQAFLKVIGVHNMACYVSAAVAVAGQVCGRPEWLELGLRHPQTGLLGLLRDGFRDTAAGVIDGLWYEGTIFYHHYSICPLITLLELAGELGDPLATHPEVRARLRAGLQGPLDLLDLDDRLPTLGDLGDPHVMRLDTYRHLYEWGAGRLDPAAFTPALARCASRCGRDGWTALAFGPATLPPAAPPPAAHTLLPGPGIAVLRDREHQLTALFRVGPHGAGHDHRDKLQLCLTARGALISPDLGTAGYSLKAVHGEVYRATFGHSTLLVNEAGQREVRQASLTTHFETRPALAVGSLRDAWPDVTATRAVWFDPPYVVLLDDLQSTTEQRYGWLFHAFGELTVTAGDAPPTLPALPDKAPWSWLTARQRGGGDGVARLVWQTTPTVALHLHLLADAPAELTWGQTPGQPFEPARRTVLLRTVGPRRRIAAVLEVPAAAGTVQGLRLAGETVVLSTTSGERRYPPGG